LAVRLAASSPGASVSRLSAVNIGISAVEARKLDGSWVPLDPDFPAGIDLLALANVGDTVTFPADMLPEGPYTALQLRINRVELALADGSRAPIEPGSRGWLVLVPVDFAVAVDRATVVELDVVLDRSLRLVNNEFEFDPQVELDGVERS